MTVSHHSHSGEFCCHAKGTLAEVVDEAIRQGFSTFGLSEHVPRYQESHMYPEESHLTPADLAATFDAYLVEAHRLKKQHAGKLDLLVGLESEYIDDAGLDELAALIERKGNAIEYVVGSVHHCDELPIDFDKDRFDECVRQQDAASLEDRLVKLFSTYFDNQHALLKRLEPEVVGHFDLCRLYYPDTDFRALGGDLWARIERNVDLAVSYGALFEVNASAFRKGWSTAYPGTEVFDLILAKGGRFTLSDDSHGPQAVGLHYDRVYAYLRERNVQELWRLVPASEGDKVKRAVRAENIEGRPWLDAWPQLLETTRRVEVRG
ncbi:hypothetical protein JCM9279_003021 [Rhodotorula babjevae]